jgi:DNA-directed RNA polymerase specialized sigma24 family protein
MGFFENFGLREFVIGTAVLLGVYSGIVILRLARLSRPRTSAPAPIKPPVEPVWNQPPAQFGEQALKAGIEAELAELRREVAALKEEVSLLKAARNVSPQYGEAVSLAQKGLPASQIAERCGISVAEAEMVCALSRARTE